jgi:hypothetical protein
VENGHLYQKEKECEKNLTEMENRKNSKRKHRHEHNKSSTQQQTKPRAKTTINSGICIDVSKRFEKIGRVGEGTYGVVYKARDKNNNGELVALKRCIPHHESSDGFPLTTLREISALRLCSHHPNIVDLLTVRRRRFFWFLLRCRAHRIILILDFLSDFRPSRLQYQALVVYFW